MGIEPTSKAWEALVLPLNYTRISVGIIPITGDGNTPYIPVLRPSGQRRSAPLFQFAPGKFGRTHV